MIDANKEGIFLEHDTTMCGVPKVWFPMQVSYSREFISYLKFLNEVLRPLRYMLDRTAMK